MSDDRSDEIEPEYQIDPKLIAKWFEIPGTENLEITLPRVALDMLYVAIEKPYFVIAQLTAALRAKDLGDEAAMEAASVDLQRETYRGLNSLRHFQTIVMASATETSLNNDWTVAEGAGHVDG